MLLSLTNPSLYFPSQNQKPSKPLLIRSSSSSNPKSAIQRISEKLRNLGYLQNPNSNPNPQTSTLTTISPGEIFIPTPQELPVHRVGHTIDVSWSTPESPVPLPGTGISRFRELWKKEKEEMKKGKGEAENSRVPMAAEIMIEREELKRLRSVGIRIEKRLKVGKAGITEGIVNGIHERWRRSELVKIKCEDLCRINMKRTHEILERKTGGLVVWRSGSIIILYRGANYKYPYFIDGSQVNCNLDNRSEDHCAIDLVATEQEQSTLSISAVNPSVKSPNNLSHSSLVIGVGSPNKVRLQLQGEVQFEEEANQLLDGLGPRFTDWWGYEPLPVDADLLPAIVRGFRRPFRLLPFGVKPKLTDREMTILRRLSRPIPCHFALGRNKNLQGLAVSMIKLWEKCEVAKIAIKRGVQNTNSGMMVEELKQLTGGVLLSRDKEFITFYRGKDFLPSAVSTAIAERRNSDVRRGKQSIYDSFMNTTAAPPLSISRPPSVDNLPKAVKQTRSFDSKDRLKRESLAIKTVETRLLQTLEKKEKAEKLLATLEKSVEHALAESDKEGITEEERYMLRKIGLRMKPFLLLGRRGVFSGTVENMHLHWKYRELIKIISKDRSIEHVENAARILEAESGGILVAVERVSKGHAIIMYRGKNYQRPADLKPMTLLNKKQAMKRSLEAQRCASLKLHVLSLSRNIDRLQHQMVKEYSMANTIQSTQSDESNTEDDLNEQNLSIVQDKGSSESSYALENTEEVNEAAAEYLNSNNHGRLLNHEEKSTTTPDSGMGSTFSFNLRQGNLIALKTIDESSDIEDVGIDTESLDSTKMTDNVEAHISNEPDFHPRSSLRQDQVSASTANYSSHHSDKDEVQLSLGATPINPDPYVSEDLTNDCSDIKNLFRAAPLSNRERLILRKQALKMKKRPVLAVGRNNIVTGVAKTIMTHFKKHPLAIVNIKGIAKGTSVQEVIFELEQATGAVLVSREPNKVILYRGWGEGEAPGSNTKQEKDAAKGLNSVETELERIPPKLVEAVRVECGLSTGRDE